MAVTADTIAVDLIANTAPYVRGMGSAKAALLDLTRAIDANTSAILTKQVPAHARAVQSADQFGAAINRLIRYYVILQGIRLAESIIKTGDALQDAADQLGVTTQELQGLQSAARDTGSSSDHLTQALGILTDNLGNAQKGEGDLAKRMRELGIPTGTTMQVLLDLADAVQKASTQNEKMAITTDAFGRSGRALVPMLNQGRAGLLALLDAAQRKGQVYDPETVRKLDAANDAFERLQVRLAGKLADPFAKFLTSLDDLVSSKSWSEFWAKMLDPRNYPDFKPQLNPTFAGGQFGTTADLRRGFVSGAFAGAVGAGAGSVPLGRTSVPPSTAMDSAAKAAREAQARELAQIAKDAAEANAELVKAQDELSVQLLKGLEGYHAAVQKQIDDELHSKVAVIDAEENAQLTSLQKLGTAWAGYEKARSEITQAAADKRAAAEAEAAAKTDAAGITGFMRDSKIAADQQVRSLNDETAALGLTAAALAKLTFVQQQFNDARQKGITLSADSIASINAEGDAIAAAAQRNHDAALNMQNAVQVSDQFRSGLADVGTQALTTSDNFGEAMASMLKSIGQLIIKMLLLKAINAALGEQGTPLPGIGSLFGTGSGASAGSVGSSAGSFSGGPLAEGGPVKRGGKYLVGEKGPELFEADEPGRIVPNKALPRSDDAETERVIRERVEPAKLAAPQDAERVIRERVEPTELRRIPDAERRIVKTGDAIGDVADNAAKAVRRFADKLAPSLSRVQSMLRQRGIEEPDFDAVLRATREPTFPAPLVAPSAPTSAPMTGRVNPLHQIDSFPRRAAGGPVSAGQMYRVNEQGVELFQPDVPGRIVPNHQLRMPDIPRIEATPRNVEIAPVFNIDARYATEGTAELIEKKVRAVAPAIVAAAVSESDRRFPKNAHLYSRDIA